MSKAKTTKKLKIENMTPKQLRQRLFTYRSSILFENSTYTFDDKIPQEIEKLPGFTNWESFSEQWDVLWVGLDPKTLKWVPGRHNSPVRKMVSPLSIVLKDERTGRPQVPAELRQIINKMEVPFKEPLPESEEDRIISERLSGKVVIDETDEEKALRSINTTLKQLEDQKALLESLLKKNK